MSFLRLYLYVAPQLLLALALVLFVRRGLDKLYPFFLAYQISQLVYFGISLAVYFWALSDPVHLTRKYQWVVTYGVAFGALFEFGVLYELADQILLSRLKHSDSFRSLLRWTVAILVLAGSVSSALLTRADLSQAISAFQALNLSVNLIKVGFLGVLVLLTRFLNISWKGLAAGISLGFGISAGAEFGATALFSVTGNVTADVVRMVAFHVCVVIWIIYILRLNNSRPINLDQVPIEQLEQHMRELKRVVRK
jgi:hypothetical protein